VKISIKEFNMDMAVKTKGIELEVRDTKGNHQGDLVVTNTKLIWCPGKTQRENGILVTWKKFIKFMDTNKQ